MWVEVSFCVGRQPASVRSAGGMSLHVCAPRVQMLPQLLLYELLSPTSGGTNLYGSSKNSCGNWHTMVVRSTGLALRLVCSINSECPQ